MKKHYSFLALAVVFALLACEKTSQTGVETPTDFQVEISISDDGFISGSGDKFVPVFSSGEKAGLFVVNGGEIVADNIEMSFDGTLWKGNVSIRESEKCSYYIYHPYKEDASSKVNVSEIEAAGFFAGLTEYVSLGTNQKNFDSDVSPYDFKYGAAVLAEAGKNGKLKLTADLIHMLAASSWSLPVKNAFVTSSGFQYIKPGEVVEGPVNIGSEEVSPCIIAGHKCYFYLPGTNDKLTVHYAKGSEEKSAEIKLDAQSGTISHTNIENVVTKFVSRDLAIGDLYYCDGSVLPVEELASLDVAPSGVAGVVFCVDPSRFSAAEKELLGEVHALVISSKFATYKKSNYIKWSDAYPEPADDGEGRYKDNVENPDYPGMFLPLINDKSDYVKSFELCYNDINGYDNTRIIRTRRAEEIKKGEYPVFSAINELSETVNISNANNTGWYLPSAGQLLDLMRNLGKAKADNSTVVDFLGNGDFAFDQKATENMIENFDSYLSKIADGERDFMNVFLGDFALWSSSYSEAYSTYDENAPWKSAARVVLTEHNVLTCISYDIIGKSNARCILAF